MTLIWGSIETHTNLTPTPGTDPFNQANLLIQFPHYAPLDFEAGTCRHMMLEPQALIAASSTAKVSTPGRSKQHRTRERTANCPLRPSTTGITAGAEYPKDIDIIHRWKQEHR